MTARSVVLLFICLLATVPPITGFVAIRSHRNNRAKAFPLTLMQASLASRHYPREDRHGAPQRTKRQERVGHLVQTELSRILHSGILRGDCEYLADDLRKRISVVSADVSPDMKQARISVSVRAGNHRKADAGEGTDPLVDHNEENIHNPAVEKRRAYSWLVRNTKPIRHALAQKLSHLKACPNLCFVQVDVAAATDVMYLIDKVAAGYKRERIGEYKENDTPSDIIFRGIEFEEVFDANDWHEEEDGQFFSIK